MEFHEDPALPCATCGDPAILASCTYSSLRLILNSLYTRVHSAACDSRPVTCLYSVSSRRLRHITHGQIYDMKEIRALFFFFVSDNLRCGIEGLMFCPF